MFDELPMVTIDPSDDSRAYRTALGRFATGIALVTALTDEGLMGITVNSFASVSLDPALVLWSPDKNSSRHDRFVGAAKFAVHVLASEQKWICDRFVRSKSDFSQIEYAENEHGVPLIKSSLAVFECERVATHDAGDHTIILGQVYRAFERPGDALVFANGGFTGLRALERTSL